MGYRPILLGLSAQWRHGIVLLCYLHPVIYLQPAGKWHDLGTHLAWPQTAHPHVLLPISSGHHWFSLMLPAICPICWKTQWNTRKPSPISCTMQMALYLALAFGRVPDFVVMSYDRFVHLLPLQYTVIMSWGACSWPSLASVWIFPGHSPSKSVSTAALLGPQKVNHFFCEILSVLKVTCGETWINDIFSLQMVCLF